MKKILVVVAHPDDEVLGCGGTLLKSAVKGAKIKTIIVSEGVTRDHIKNNTVLEEQKRRSDWSIKVSKLFKGSKVVNLNFPDQRPDTIALLKITQKIEKRNKKL